MNVEDLARRLFERQCNTYDAEPEQVEAGWADEGVRLFWLDEAGAILGWINESKEAAVWD